MKRCWLVFVPLLLGCESEPTVDAGAEAIEAQVQDEGPRSWHEQDSPKAGPPRVIGSYTLGCIQGAVPLMPEGVGYQVMRLERGRFFGHPDLVDYLENLGEEVHERGLGMVLVGDLSQPRGGPTLSDHRSHQTGLDVDLWYRYPDYALVRDLTPEERETLASPSVVDLETKTLTHAWRPSVAEVLELAARDERVERVFVHPAIKRELCRHVTGDRSWLRKIRPWRGHHDHYHVRLACPPDSDQCKGQHPPSTAEGCGKSLDSWFRPPPRARARRHKRAHRTPRKPRSLPAGCAEVQR